MSVDESEGYSVICPISLNSLDANGQVRNDVAYSFGKLQSQGSLYHTESRLRATDDDMLSWKQCPVRDRNTNTVGINVFDKLKVVTAHLHHENMTFSLYRSGSEHVETQTLSNDAKKNQQTKMSFLKEVIKCDAPHSTVARYKLGDVSTALDTPHAKNRAGYTININLTRGIHEAGVCVAMSAANSTAGSNARVRLDRAKMMSSMRVVNNSITADSVIACVNNLDFKKRATESSIFSLAQFARFKTHKKIVSYKRPGFSQPANVPDLMSALSCTCIVCNDQSNAIAHTFHRRKKNHMTASSITGADATYVESCLRPLQDQHKIQVYDSCCNCSSVSGPMLITAFANVVSDLLRDTWVAHIDLALVRITGFIEAKTNALLPSHISDICEIMCWQLGTRFLPRFDQLRVAKQVLEPIFAKLVCSRSNFAQSGGWTQVLVRGPRRLLGTDRSNVSHKYRNPDTRQLFESKKRPGDDDEVAGSTDKYRIIKRCRRRRSPPQLYSDLRRFGDNMESFDMLKPDPMDC